MNNLPRDRLDGEAWVSLDLPQKTKEQLHEINIQTARAGRRFMRHRLQEHNPSRRLHVDHIGGLRLRAEQSQDHLDDAPNSACGV